MSAAPEFEAIVRDHTPLIARIASTYERRPALIEELTQDVFLAIFRALPSFRGDASLRTFIARIAHNVGVDHVRRATRRPVEQADDILQDKPDLSADAEEQAEKNLARDKLLTAVRALPVVQRQIVSLHLEGFENGEIGEVLGLTPGNVRVRLHRARQTLSEMIG